eukprot:1159980-Pelagomonas_calceolata.AAC.4
MTDAQNDRWVENSRTRKQLRAQCTWVGDQPSQGRVDCNASTQQRSCCHGVQAIGDLWATREVVHTVSNTTDLLLAACQGVSTLANNRGCPQALPRQAGKGSENRDAPSNGSRTE